MTYLTLMQGFSAARIPRRRGSTIEDQQLRTGPTISIVDDDESMRCAVKSLVTSLGFAACTFASAEEFLASDCLDQTRCLILDVAMPGMSGPDLQRELARRRQEIPIVFITAHADVSVRPSLLERGAVECLLKPFSETALLDALRAALRAA